MLQDVLKDLLWPPHPLSLPFLISSPSLTSPIQLHTSSPINQTSLRNLPGAAPFYTVFLRNLPGSPPPGLSQGPASIFLPSLAPLPPAPFLSPRLIAWPLLLVSFSALRFRSYFWGESHVGFYLLGSLLYPKCQERQHMSCSIAQETFAEWMREL